MYLPQSSLINKCKAARLDLRMYFYLQSIYRVMYICMHHVKVRYLRPIMWHVCVTRTAFAPPLYIIEWYAVTCGVCLRRKLESFRYISSAALTLF